MGALKGQNLRIYAVDLSGGQQNAKYKVIGMATNCVITLNTNQDDASTKDDVGMASKPTIVSKSWQVQVDTMNVSDVATMLNAIKNSTIFILKWDLADTTNNQTAEQDSLSRTGQAYLTDFTASFNDRENSVKNLQFTGISAISHDSTTDSAVIATGSYTKGQTVRLYLGSDNTATPSKVIGAAKQLSLHVSVQLENSTTKDTTGDWEVQEPVGISYDITSNALVRSGESISSSVQAQALNDLETIYEAGNPVKWLIANVSGDNNRTKGSVICSGSCIISQLQINAQNKQSATYQANLLGYGDMTVSA